MATAAGVIAVARGQIGYHETGDNITKFWQELDPGLQGQPWCVGFGSWCYLHAGQQMPAIDRSYGAVSAFDVMNYARAHDLWSASGHYAPGDMIVFGGGEHGAICESDNGSVVTTIDGNWGDVVQRVARGHGPFVSGAFQMSRLLTGSGPTPPQQPPSGSNPAMVRGIQYAVRITADGLWGDVTSFAATQVIRAVRGTVAERKYLQTRIGTPADGMWGPASARCWIMTIANIQRAIGANPNGIWDAASQSRWNAAYAANYRRY